MAGEIRREDVAIGFNIDYQKLEKVDAGIDKIVDKLGSLGHKFEPVNQQVKTFGTTFVDTIDKALGANKKLDASNSEVSKGIQNNSRVATTFRDKMANINSVTDSYTASQERHYHQVGTAMDQVTKHASILGKKLHDLPKETTAKVSFDTNGVQATDLTGQLHKVDKSMDKTAKKSRRLHDIIMGTFVGTAISNGIAGITNGLHEAAQAGMEYNKEQDTMKTVWTSLTTEAPKDGKNLVKYINSMSQHSIYAADALNEMAQSFYHVHSNEKETKNWTNDFIALGSTLHMSNDALAESGEQFAKIVAGGKASSEDMAVMINRFPMFGEALQKATGKSMKQLYAMSAAGKLSAKQFTDTLTYLGKKYEGGTKEAMTSFLGMSMYLKSRFSTLAGDVMKTSFEMDKKTASSMQDLLSDKMMKKYAKGISSALGVVTGAAVHMIGYLDKHKDTVIDVLGTTGDIAGVFGKEVWSDTVDILDDIGSAFGLVDKNGQAAKDPLEQIDDLLKGIDKHKEGIRIAAKLMVGFFAIKKATEFVKLLKEVNTQLKISAALNAIGSFGGSKTPKGTPEIPAEIPTGSAPKAEASAGGGLLTKGKGLLSGAAGLVKGSLIAAGVTTIIDRLPSAIAGQAKGVKEASQGKDVSKSTKKQFLGGVGSDEWIGNKLGSLWKWATTTRYPEGQGPKKATPKKETTKSNPYSGVSKDTKSFLKSTRSQIKTATNGYLDIMATGSKKAISKNKTTYSQLLANVDKYAGSQKKSADGSVNYLRKIGAITATEQTKALQKEDSGSAKRVASVKKTIAQIERDEKNGGGKRSQLVAKLDGQLLRLTDTGAKNQRKIYKQLHDGVTSLTSKQYSAVMKKSRQARTSTVTDARKQYDAQISSASKTYSKTLKSAKATYGVHSDMYKKIKKYADQQYTDTTSAAHQQYKDTVKWANKSEKAVELAAANAAGGVYGIMGVMSDNITILGKQLATAVGGTWHKPKTNDQAIHDNTDPAGNLAKGARKLQGKTTVLKSGQAGIQMPDPLTGHASGGSIAKPGMAMVAEAGTEIGYDSRSGKYQIFDHGPQLVHLTAGMHIMNHRDSMKAMRGGLGRGRILPGYAKGTGSVGAASVATTVKVKCVNDATMKNTEYKTKRSADQIGTDIVSGYGKGTKGAQKKLTSLNKKSSQILKDTKNGTNKQTDLIRKQMIADFDAAQKGADKQLAQLKNGGLKTMGKLQDGMAKADQTIVSDFGNNFGKLPGLAKSAMKGAITSLNGGFTGIDSALSQFGGNKQVLRPIHYATGSNGPIDSDQLAVLNDASVGPRQELVGRGSQLLRPVGDNVAVHLKKGDEVFNGTQVERAKSYLPHFKKGTGASDSKLRSLASSNASAPSKAFSQEFTVNVKANGANLQKGLTSTASAGAKTIGVPWENAMWGYIESLINSGGGVGGGPVLHSPGSGWMKTSGFGNRGAVGGGFSSHDGNDFSGAKVVHAMQDAVVTRVGGAPSGWGGSDGIGESVATKGGNLSLIYQELNGKSNSGATILVHKGEHVKQGQAIAKLGPSGTHVHVGASTEGLWSHGGDSTRGWLDVTKLHSSFGNSESKKSKDKPKVSKAMTSLVKSQLGPTAVKWIKKNLQDSIGDADIGNLSGSMMHRAKALAAAIKKMYGSATNAGIAAVLGSWEFESGLNPSAVNPSGGASGLGQWLGGRKTALINYSKRHGKNWKSAEAQLEFALKGDGSDSSVLKSVLRGSGSVASLANKLSSQWERGGYNAQHVAGARKIEAALHDEGGWSKKGKLNIFGEKSKEVTINPRKASADGLIDSAIKARSKVDGSGLAGTLNQVLSSKPASRVQPAKVAGSAGGRNVTIKMTNHIKIEGAGDDSAIKKSVEAGLQSGSEKMIDMVRRVIGTDQGREGFVI
ncbi:phage tail tip lysozyme [Levilactobacillus suantsaii]|uniref:Uncharacterized protein n=1 Tax=Levilactobacillus suantsaii TaxID=2292255 RepID=A0A4Q0VJ85_9LACO|nr:phage tail tip lysozyme [Levilactobacillus suantsaii]RXI77379.1 hypothetical protein DXH47_09315 [Levilactobacillus suantsaii]